MPCLYMGPTHMEDVRRWRRYVDEGRDPTTYFRDAFKRTVDDEQVRAAPPCRAA